MIDIEKLRHQAEAATAALRRAEELERDKINLTFIGKCFRYTNSYSCPKPDEVWWAYTIVISVENGGLNVFQFHTDFRGDIRIDTDYIGSVSDRWEEISRNEFNRNWNILKATISAYVLPSSLEV